MNNNTETIEQGLTDKCFSVLDYLYPNCQKEMSYVQFENAINSLKSIANWQKEQDEDKFKEDPVNFLLNNALRLLTEEQRESLTLSLIERTKYKELLDSYNELLRDMLDTAKNGYVDAVWLENYILNIINQQN